MLDVDTGSLASRRPQRAAKTRFQNAMKSYRNRRTRSKDVSEDPDTPKLMDQSGNSESTVSSAESSNSGLDMERSGYVANTDGLIYPIKLSEIIELNQSQQIGNGMYECDTCSIKLEDYEQYVDHVTEHIECHAVCALCPIPNEPFSTTAYAQHIITHYSKVNDKFLCPFCNVEIESPAGHELVQHYYYTCPAVGKCLICLDVIIGETTLEHRIRKHGRLLERFLCTSCVTGFPTLLEFESHECNYVMRCVCDLCEKFDSVEAANRHVTSSENQDDHGILVPENKGYVREFINNPHSVEALNYEKEAKDKFFLSPVKNRKRQCRSPEEYIPCPNKTIAVDTSYVNLPVDTTPKLISPKIEVISQGDEPNVATSPIPSTPVTEDKAASPPPLPISSTDPLLIGSRALKTTYMEKVRKVETSTTQSCVNRVTSTIQKQEPSLPKPSLTNNSFRLSVMQNHLANVRHSTNITNPSGCHLPGVSHNPVNTQCEMNGSPNSPISRVIMPRDKISVDMRNKYLNHKRIYGMVQSRQQQLWQETLENIHQCYCGTQHIGVLNFVQHIEMTHFHDRMINTALVPHDTLLCVCLHCMVTFESSYHYAAHVKRHEAAKQRFKKCQCCSLLWDPEIIEDHLRTNKTNWVCGQCNEKFLTEMAFFHHIGEKNHSDIFYYCKGCNIGTTQSEPMIKHVTKCASREGLGFILMDYLQYRPLKVMDYMKIASKHNVHKQVTNLECRKASNLYIKSGDVILRKCCRLFHKYDESVDKIDNPVWKTDKVTPDMFLSFQKSGVLPTDWHITFEKLPQLYPKLEDSELRPPRALAHHAAKMIEESRIARGYVKNVTENSPDEFPLRTVIHEQIRRHGGITDDHMKQSRYRLTTEQVRRVLSPKIRMLPKILPKHIRSTEPEVIELDD